MEKSETEIDQMIKANMDNIANLASKYKMDNHPHWLYFAMITNSRSELEPVIKSSMMSGKSFEETFKSIIPGANENSK